MVRYLSLLSFTQQGITGIDKSPERASKFSASVNAAGGRVLSVYWSLGELDAAIVFEAPDDHAAATLLVELAKEGNVRARSQRIYNEKEFESIVAKIG